jgi:hypothetical protein
MKKFAVLFILMFVPLFIQNINAQIDARMLQYPAVSKTQIVFPMETIFGWSQKTVVLPITLLHQKDRKFFLNFHRTVHLSHSAGITTAILMYM